MTSFLNAGISLAVFLASQVITGQGEVPSNISAADPVLFNGRIYTYHVPPGTKGHQYLKEPAFGRGWIRIRGVFYEDQNINFDAFHQRLILKYTTAEGIGRQLVVSDAWLEAFGYSNMHFQVLHSGSKKEIYQVIGTGSNRVYYKWRKELKLSKTHGDRNFMFSKPVKTMYLVKNGMLYRYWNAKSFSSAYGPLNEDIINEYIHAQKINLKKSDDHKIENFLASLDSLVTDKDKMSEYAAVDSMPLPIGSISLESGSRVYYRTDSGNVLKPDIQYKTLNDLRSNLEGSEMVISEWNDDLVIIPRERYITGLPEYRQASVTEDNAEPSDSITRAEARYITSRNADITEIIRVGNPGVQTTNARTRILGRVLDSDSGEPLISVPVYIAETKSGTVTDMDGYFILTLAPGRYNVSIGYLGYAGKKFVLEVFSEGNFVVELQKAAIRLKDVVISAESQSSMRIKDAGLDRISVQNLKSIPVMMGEHDILKVSVTLPGIISAGEGGAGLNVRGSGYDQNAFYINSIPVYNTSHLFGFFSAFNSDIIKEFSIYKGYIPVQYGGRLASVFDITARQGNRKHMTAHGGISPIAGNLTIEGPVLKNKSSFIVSGRSSYSDWILSRLNDTTIRSSSANFNDISGGLNWDISKSQVSLFFYHSYDNFRLAEISRYRYSNNGASLTLSHTFGNSVRSEFSLTGSGYDFTTTDRLEISSAYTHRYKLEQYGVHTHFRHLLSENNTLEYGTDISLIKLDRGAVSPFDNTSLRDIQVLGKEKGIEGSLFVSDNLALMSFISLDLGLRYTLYSPAGPANVFNYAPGSQPDQKYITDTLSFSRNEPIRWYHNPDIRASLNFKTDENGSIKAAFNQMHQSIFMLNTSISVAPNTQWKLADYHLKPSESRLVSLGIFRILPAMDLEASAEVYYKNTINNPEFIDGADFLENPHVETLVLQGNQQAYGFEFYIKRSRRRIDGWLSYTFSRSVNTVDGSNSRERINNGRPFPSNHDIPHSFNMIMSYHFSRRIILSGAFIYQTGKPATYPESVYYINGSPYLNYSERNGYRIPDYIRTDLSLTVEGNLKANKPLHSSFVFNVYNAAGRMNPYSVYFTSENGRIRSYKYSVIGVPVFTATWQFKLGNYASD